MRNKEQIIREYIRECILMMEHWDQHLEKVMNPDELPWDNDPEAETTKDNPMNPYDANKELRTVKAWGHPKTYSAQRAGVKKGSGSPGGQRFPGGTRQATTGGY